MTPNDARMVLRHLPEDLKLFELLLPLKAKLASLGPLGEASSAYKLARTNGIPTECVSKVLALLRKVK